MVCGLECPVQAIDSVTSYEVGSCKCVPQQSNQLFFFKPVKESTCTVPLVVSKIPQEDDIYVYAEQHLPAIKERIEKHNVALKTVSLSAAVCSGVVVVKDSKAAAGSVVVRWTNDYWKNIHNTSAVRCQGEEFQFSFSTIPGSVILMAIQFCSSSEEHWDNNDYKDYMFQMPV